MRQPGSPADIRISLPLKIAGIVFWGLVAIGALMAALAMPWMERIVRLEQAAQPRELASKVWSILDEAGGAPLQTLRPRLVRAIRDTGVAALRIETGHDEITVGLTPDSSLNLYSTSLEIGSQIDGNDFDAVLSIYQYPIEQHLLDRQKKLMLILGASFFVFGLVIQWILQRVITKPFHNMINAAQGCSEGNHCRFDDARDDEFGFLARFINKAVQSLQDRQQELREALERAQAGERALSDEKKRAEVTLHSIAEGVLTTDHAGRIRFMNPVAEHLTGWTLEDAHGRPIDEVIQLRDEPSGETIPCAINDALRENRVARNLVGRMLVRQGGEEIAVSESAAPMHDVNGQLMGAVLVFDDIRQTRELTRRLSHQATHDALTGLFNRSEFEKRLQRALEDTHRNGTHNALCYIDLDQFKIVNDTCGHMAGDELLREIGHTLAGELRDSDTVARLGGDEFGLLFSGCDLDAAASLAAKLHRAIRSVHFVWDGRNFEVGASIGIVPLGPRTGSVAEALSAADMACYAAKEQGRGRVHLSEPDDRELERHRSEMRWVGRIRDALREQRFVLYQQAIVPVGDPECKPCHVELLLRMLDDDGRLIPPGRFLPAAERYGLMPAIDTWVIEHAFRWLADVQHWNDAQPMVAINLSGQSLSTPGFLAQVVDQLDCLDLPYEQICFEITETAAIANFDTAMKFMRILHGMGCQFALDDFGSGMSSFAYLKQLPVDYLKIDGSYVRDLLRDPIDRAMVEAANKVGHAIGIRTIAEYVEDIDTLAALEEIGVDFAQGYGIARPAALEHSPPAAGQARPRA